MQNPLTNVCQSNMKGQFQLKEIRLSISNAILLKYNMNLTVLCVCPFAFDACLTLSLCKADTIHILATFYKAEMGVNRTTVQLVSCHMRF
jgi:hypothetical protein